MPSLAGMLMRLSIKRMRMKSHTCFLPGWDGRSSPTASLLSLIPWAPVVFCTRRWEEYHFCKLLAFGAIKCLLGIFLSCTENVRYNPQKSHLWGFKGENSTGQWTEEIRGGPERILRKQTVHQAEELHHTTWVMDFPAICTFCNRLIWEIEIHKKNLIYWYCINDYAMDYATCLQKGTVIMQTATQIICYVILHSADKETFCKSILVLPFWTLGGKIPNLVCRNCYPMLYHVMSMSCYLMPIHLAI